MLDVIRELNARVANVRGISLYMQPVQDLTWMPRSRGASTSSSSRIPIRRSSPVGAKLVDALAARPELQDVSSNLLDKGLAVDITLDRGHRRALRHHHGDARQCAL